MVMIEFDLFDLDKLLRSCPNGSTKDKIKKAREICESGGIVFFNGSTSLDWIMKEIIQNENRE